MTDKSWPLVSILMPIRNEACFIERAIQSILNNDYPQDKVEVLVMDGCSDDGTQAVVEKIAEQHPSVRLLENPGRIVSTALNIGLRACRGDVFIRVDGHAEVPPDFISKSVRCLARHPEAWVVGGYWKTVSKGYVGNVIAAATQSPVGVGNAKHRLGNFDGWVDTLPYGAHHKWVVDKIGYFDEDLVRNQDDEFNMRILSAGGKIWLSSSICSTYYSRSSLRMVWRQYFQYGFWRVRTWQKHGKPATFRQVVPLLFILSLIFLVFAGFVWQTLWWILGVILVIYGFGLVCGSIHVGRRVGYEYSILAPVVFVILHLGYGVGCLWGISRFILLRGWKVRRPHEFKLSR